MRSSPVLLLSVAWKALAREEHHHHKRDVTITNTIISTIYTCPCTTYTPVAYPSSTSIGSPTTTSYSSTTLAPPASSSISLSSSSSPASSTSSLSSSPSSQSTSTTISSSSTTTSSSAASTVTISAATLPDYQTTVLQQHNIHRLNHTAVNLTWSNTMASTAASIAASCVYQHNTTANGGGYGQNIGAGYAPGQIAFMITNAMYNGEINNYPQPYGNDNPDLSTFSEWGHYSQIVWADTTQVGCATQYCPNGLQNTGSGVPPYFTVCNYSPAGNFIGEFSRVHRPLGNPSVVIVN